MLPSLPRDVAVPGGTIPFLIMIELGPVHGVSMIAKGLTLLKAVPDGAASYYAELVARFDTDRVGQG